MILTWRAAVWVAGVFAVLMILLNNASVPEPVVPVVDSHYCFLPQKIVHGDPYRGGAVFR
jgi:hypothetical protein